MDHAVKVTRGHRFPVKGMIIGLAILGLFVVVRLLPISQWLEQLNTWVLGLQAWGFVVYIFVYALAALLFVPGSALTIAAGVIFGLLGGTVVVSIGSTLGAAGAFLIARYLARGKVEAHVGKHPKFQAVDRAIAVGGWKIVALLRLSPIVPYNLSNYFYGLTAIRFWPYILASWLAMLPGTLLYVYLGVAGKAGLEAAAGGSTRDPFQYLYLGIGLAATVAVTIYLTRLAGAALRNVPSGVTVDNNDEPLGAAHSESTVATEGKAHASSSWRALSVSVICLCVIAAIGYWQRGPILGLFGPPAVTLGEQYAEHPGGPIFDHLKFDALLKKHVTKEFLVDYVALGKDQSRLDEYISALAAAPFDELGRDEKMALLINAYNAFTLRLILDHWPVKSIKDIPSAKRWRHKRWKIGSLTLSLSQIENDYLRAKFREPRIHFAINCASIGCPPLRREAYVGSRIEQQLQEQSKYMHQQSRWFRLDRHSNTVHLAAIYKWYKKDFEQVGGSVLGYAERFVPALGDGPDKGWTVRWLDYDWSLNSAKKPVTSPS